MVTLHTMDHQVGEWNHRIFSRHRYRCALLLTSLFAIASMPANAAESVKLTLPQLIQTARMENKDLRAARSAVDIGRARLVQAGLLPNPRLNLSGGSDAPFRNEGEYNASLSLSQEFPIAGRILRQQDVARLDVPLAEAEIEDAERKLAGEVAASFYRYLVLDRKLVAQDHLIELEQKMVKVTGDRMHAAEVSELDVNTMQLELKRLQQERTLLFGQKQALIVDLNKLLGRPATTPLELDAAIPDIEPLAGLDQQQESAFKRRPDLRMAMLKADRAGAERALARAQRWEDWTVGLGVEQDRLSVEGAPRQGSDRAMMLSLSIPLPLLNRNQGAIAEAEASGLQAEDRIEALRLTIDAEVASAYAEVSRLQEPLRQYRDTLLPLSDRNVRLVQGGYAHGLVSILEVTQTLRQQGDLDVAYLDTLDHYLQAVARMHTAIGDYTAPASAPGWVPGSDRKED